MASRYFASDDGLEVREGRLEQDSWIVYLDSVHDAYELGMETCESGDLSSLQQLLENTSPDHKQVYSLYRNVKYIHRLIENACDEGHLCIVKYLLDHFGIDPSYDHNILLRMAIDSHGDIVGYLRRDVRVLFSDPEKHSTYVSNVLLHDARHEWYARRSLEMRELHDELVATCNTHKN